MNHLTQGGNFAILPAAIRYDRNLSDSEKLLFCELTALSNKKGYCYASNKYLSDLFNVTHETISRRINRLKEKGYIHVELIREGKEIKQRHIYPRMDNALPIDDRNNRGIDDSVNRGIDGSVNRGIDDRRKENNITINKLNNNNINNNTNVQLEIEHDEPAAWESDFNEWWEMYGKKVGKKKSRTLFKKYHKQDGYEIIKKGTLAYLKTITDKKYQKDPERFLKNELYHDIEGFEELAKQKAASGFNGRGYQYNPYADDGTNLDF